MSKALEHVEFREMPSLDGDVNMLLPIEVLGLSVRTKNALILNGYPGGIFYIGQLLSQSENDLLKYPNLGRKNIREISAVLSARGYRVGEGAEYVAAIEFSRFSNLRAVFGIPDDAPTPTEWVSRADRQPVVDPLKELEINKQFVARLTVDILEAEQKNEEIERVKGLCQKAFEIAILNAAQNALCPQRAVPLQDALKAALPFDEAAHESMRANIMQGYILATDVRLSPEAAAVFGPTFLRRVARSLNGPELTGFLAAALKPANEPQ